MINGDPGWLGWCSTAALADAAARAIAEQGADSVIVHRGESHAVVRVLGRGDHLEALVKSRCDLACYRTATRQVLRHVPTWPAGSVTPGVTMLFSIHRRPGMEPDAFHEWWENSHAPVALRHHVGMWDYAQVSVVETLHGEPLDGFAVTQWPTLDDLMHRFSSGPDGTEALRSDAAQFTDPNTLRRYVLDELEVVPAPWPTHGQLPVGMARSTALDGGPMTPVEPLPDGVSLEVRSTAEGHVRFDVLWRTTVTADEVSTLSRRFDALWHHVDGALVDNDQPARSS
jgi:hypothetical protein